MKKITKIDLDNTFLQETGVILDSKRIIDYTKNRTGYSIDNAVIKNGGIK